MRLPDISKSESAVMEALCEGAPQTASEVRERFAERRKWVENSY